MVNTMKRLVSLHKIINQSNFEIVFRSFPRQILSLFSRNSNERNERSEYEHKKKEDEAVCFTKLFGEQSSLENKREFGSKKLTA